MSDQKMNPVAKELWLAALRSGKYTQGKGWLNRNNELCCLGVLCEVAIESGEKVERAEGTVTSHLGTSPLVQYNKSETFPPDEVYSWSGLIGVRGVDITLSSMNDSGENTFLDIANWIEENL